MHASDCEWLHFLTSNCPADQITRRIIIRSAKFRQRVSTREQATKRNSQSRVDLVHCYERIDYDASCLIHLDSLFMCASERLLSFKTWKNTNKWSWIIPAQLSLPRSDSGVEREAAWLLCHVVQHLGPWTSCAQTKWNVYSLDCKKKKKNEKELAVLLSEQRRSCCSEIPAGLQCHKKTRTREASTRKCILAIF